MIYPSDRDVQSHKEAVKEYNSHVQYGTPIKCPFDDYWKAYDFWQCVFYYQMNNRGECVLFRR